MMIELKAFIISLQIDNGFGGDVPCRSAPTGR